MNAIVIALLLVVYCFLFAKFSTVRKFSLCLCIGALVAGACNQVTDNVLYVYLAGMIGTFAGLFGVSVYHGMRL